MPTQIGNGSVVFGDASLQQSSALTGNPVSGHGFIHENYQTIEESYTMPTGKSGMSVGPITISALATVTIPPGSRWVVL